MGISVATHPPLPAARRPNGPDSHESEFCACHRGFVFVLKSAEVVMLISFVRCRQRVGVSMLEADKGRDWS